MIFDRSLNIIIAFAVLAAMISIILNMPSYVGDVILLPLSAFTLIIALGLAFQKR